MRRGLYCLEPFVVSAVDHFAYALASTVLTKLYRISRISLETLASWTWSIRKQAVIEMAKGI